MSDMNLRYWVREPGLEVVFNEIQKRQIRKKTSGFLAFVTNNNEVMDAEKMKIHSGYYVLNVRRTCCEVGNPYLPCATLPSLKQALEYIMDRFNNR